MFEHLGKHTTEFSEEDLRDVIQAIVDRAVEDYGQRIKIDRERLTKALYCAHRTKPARLIALLETCMFDFPSDVIMGAYRHYDPATDTMRNGFTLQHSEPPEPWELDLLDEDEERLP